MSGLGKKYRIRYFAWPEVLREFTFDRAMKTLEHEDFSIQDRDQSGLSELSVGKFYTDNEGDVWERIA